jgi:uncharacterized damage-inducible protein DinB
MVGAGAAHREQKVKKVPRQGRGGRRQGLHPGRERRTAERIGHLAIDQSTNKEEAMQTITAAQAKFLLQDVYLETLKNESRITKKILEAVPVDKCEYRPDPVSKSAIELVRHIATADNRFLETVINGVFDVNAAVIPENVKTPAEIAAWYEGRFTKNFEALSKLSGEQLVKIVDFRGMFQRPAVTFVMMGLYHTIHHRGQLSSYLRSMGAKVPSIYGKSYDDAQSA